MVTVQADTQNVQDNANVLSAKTERYIDKVKMEEGDLATLWCE